MLNVITIFIVGKHTFFFPERVYTVKSYTQNSAGELSGIYKVFVDPCKQQGISN